MTAAIQHKIFSPALPWMVQIHAHWQALQEAVEALPVSSFKECLLYYVDRLSISTTAEGLMQNMSMVRFITKAMGNSALSKEVALSIEKFSQLIARFQVAGEEGWR